MAENSRVIKIKDLDFTSAAHFLYLTVVDVYSLHTGSESLNRAIKNLTNRWLFKRALVISKKTVGDSLNKYSDLTKFYERPDHLEFLNLPGSPATIRLRDVFPVDEWTTAFAQNKWQGFVFCPPEHREDVQEAAKKVLHDAYGLEFNEYAGTLCKMDDAA